MRFDDEALGALLVPCAFCGVERPRSALKRFHLELACASCRGGSYADDGESDAEEEVDESERELDFDEVVDDAD